MSLDTGMSVSQRIVTDGSGESRYASGMHCVWHLSAQPSRQVTLRFLRLDVICPDAVTVFSGTSTAAPALARLCGSDSINQRLVSTSEYMTLEFRSGANGGGGNGFEALFAELSTGTQSAPHRLAQQPAAVACLS